MEIGTLDSGEGAVGATHPRDERGEGGEPTVGAAVVERGVEAKRRVAARANGAGVQIGLGVGAVDGGAHPPQPQRGVVAAMRLAVCAAGGAATGSARKARASSSAGRRVAAPRLSRRSSSRSPRSPVAASVICCMQHMMENVAAKVMLRRPRITCPAVGSVRIAAT